jgi:two-component system cell cycle sensor histidine kinase/response regulator CckA
MMKRADTYGVSPISIRPALTGTSVRAIVLFVSGDPDLRAVATRVLTQEGYSVATAAHAGHAILAGLTLDRIDVLVSDMVLDDMPGPSLADRLKRHHSGVRCLFMADCGTPAADGMIVRPFTRDDLLVALEALNPSAASQAS